MKPRRSRFSILIEKETDALTALNAAAGSHQRGKGQQTLFECQGIAGTPRPPPADAHLPGNYRSPEIR